MFVFIVIGTSGTGDERGEEILEDVSAFLFALVFGLKGAGAGTGGSLRVEGEGVDENVPGRRGREDGGWEKLDDIGGDENLAPVRP